MLGQLLMEVSSAPRVCALLSSAALCTPSAVDNKTGRIPCFDSSDFKRLSLSLPQPEGGWVGGGGKKGVVDR